MELESRPPPLHSVLVSKSAGGTSAAPSADLRRVVARWWGVARLWWRSTDRKRAWLYCLACLAFSLTNMGMLLWISYAQNALQSGLSEKNEAGFYSAVTSFVAIIVLAAPLFAMTDYVDSCLTVAWRSWLTHHMIRSYFAQHAYFKLKMDPQAIDNPDQRICEDVRAYCSTSVALTISIARKILNCVAFASLLWRLAPRLAAFLLIYSVGGTWITASGFGRRLMHLTYSVLQREADLRFALIRVRENAESIAFYAGDQRESELATSKLARVIATIFGKVRWEAYLSLWQNAYTYATILLPSLLLHKRYFKGEIRFGDISQASFAFHTIEGALSYIVTHLSDISQLAAQTDRLDALLTTLGAQAEGLPGGVIRKASQDGGVVLDSLCLSTPHGEVTVCKGLSLALSPGQSLLIVGPSGVGKTSIMRAVAGLWSDGSGTITTPADMFFVPQRPYMPLGTLREQLTFPDSYSHAGSPAGGPAGASQAAGPGASASASTGGGNGGGGVSSGRRRDGAGGDSDSGEDERAGLLEQTTGSAGSAGGTRRLAILRGTASGYRRAGSGRSVDGAVPAGEVGGMLESGVSAAAASSAHASSAAQDAELITLLQDVCLPQLLARVGGLDAEADWAHMLSLGEQQRISLARLLHHKPAVAFLDEATSALDTATEQTLYRRLQQHCACYISIAHRKQLAAFHTDVLEAAGDGRWVVHDAADFLRQLKE